MSRIETIGDATPTVTIYALCDYPSWEPRYIGKTVQRAGQRHKAHIRDAKAGKRLPVHYWLRKKLAAGERLAIKHLQWLPASGDWAAAERAWIERFRSGGRLLNLTDGGEGLAGHSFSQDHRDKIAAALRSGSSFACEKCGAEFWRKRNQIRRGHNRFCSRACSNRRAGS